MTKKNKIIPITCSSSHQVEASLLQPIQGSLKQRTRKQLQNLKELILKHGFSFPIYVWENDNNYFTLDGHGRDYICKTLIADGYLFKQKNDKINTSLPCIFVDAADKKEAKEKLLAVNSSFGTITEEGLYSYLFEPGFEVDFGDISECLELPGINLGEFENNYLLETNELVDNRKYKFIFSQPQIKQTIKNNFPSYKSTKEIIEGIIDLPLAMHQFNKLCAGYKNVGTGISLLFNPHRLETQINNRKYSIAEAFVKKDKGMVTSLSQWLSKQHDVVHHNQYIEAARVGTGTQAAHEFKPYLARDIYKDYCKPGAKVLDPCAGWGGRMLGFASSNLGGEYFATDPSTKTYNGLLELKKFIQSAEEIPEIKITLNNLPFEDLTLVKNSYDFAFTSPPYFNTEIYCNEETQAFNRYKTIEEFNSIFLKSLIEKTMDALKPGCAFVINIGGSQFRFDKVIQEICETLGLKLKELFDYKIGKGESIVSKFKGDKLENTIKANDLFFEIRKIDASN